MADNDIVRERRHVAARFRDACGRGGFAAQERIQAVLYKPYLRDIQRTASYSPVHPLRHDSHNRACKPPEDAPALRVTRHTRDALCHVTMEPRDRQGRVIWLHAVTGALTLTGSLTPPSPAGSTRSAHACNPPSTERVSRQEFDAKAPPACGGKRSQ